MKQYIGTKIVSMTPMNRSEYNIFRGWELPADENGSDEGYLVEYLDGGKPNTPHYAGYVSWSPKEQAEAAYRQVDGMTFGLALEALKKGLRVSRSGWNGKGMWLALSPGTSGLPPERFWAKPNADYAREKGSADVLPYITMKTATGEILMGWLASQTDMLAEDWVLV